MLGNLYCVTKTSCTVMISLPMVYSLKNLLREYNNIVNSKQVDFKSLRSVNGSGSERGSSTRSDKTCHKCNKKGHIKKYCRSKIYGSIVNTPKKSINELPKWVTRKPIDSDTKYLITATMTHNNKKYKW